jgi:hypothetical protein
MAFRLPSAKATKAVSRPELIVRCSENGCNSSTHNAECYVVRLVSHGQQLLKLQVAREAQRRLRASGNNLPSKSLNLLSCKIIRSSSLQPQETRRLLVRGKGNPGPAPQERPLSPPARNQVNAILLQDLCRSQTHLSWRYTALQIDPAVLDRYLSQVDWSHRQTYSPASERVNALHERQLAAFMAGENARA